MIPRCHQNLSLLYEGNLDTVRYRVGLMAENVSNIPFRIPVDMYALGYSTTTEALLHGMLVLRKEIKREYPFTCKYRKCI
ncbi:hypothetical protein HZS_4030 [Henneguya salminicola]|nr:hypothetical protein HZS_4030 [Henneguya salminicola]